MAVWFGSLPSSVNTTCGGMGSMLPLIASAGKA